MKLYSRRTDWRPKNPQVGHLFVWWNCCFGQGAFHVGVDSWEEAELVKDTLADMDLDRFDPRGESLDFQIIRLILEYSAFKKARGVRRVGANACGVVMYGGEHWEKECRDGLPESDWRWDDAYCEVDEHTIEDEREWLLSQEVKK